MTPKQDLILIVDDHEENLLLLDRILVNQGYLVMKTMHGEKVEPLAERYLPQLILLDIQLPVMDGYEVCRRLKANPQTACIPVIFISALDSEEDRVKGFEAGGVDYISKPIQIAETLARVHTHVTLRQLQEQLGSTNRELVDRISDLTLSQIKLHDREGKLQAIVSALPHLTFIHDAEGHYLEILGDKVDLLAMRRTDMLGRRLQDVLPPQTGALIMEAIQAVLMTGESKVIEYQLPVVSGRELWFEGRIALLDRDQPAGGRVVFVASEITERVELYQKVNALATQDPLTDCFNRRHFLHLAEKEIQRAIRYDRSLSLLILDIDHFKQVNDLYGHPTGDLVLRSMVTEIQHNLREVDILGRYGGEEFIVLLPETGMNGVRDVAERLRQSIQNLVVDTRQGSVAVTVSIGAACLRALERQRMNLEAFIDEADRALYLAKEHGRNCVRDNHPTSIALPVVPKEILRLPRDKRTA